MGRMAKALHFGLALALASWLMALSTGECPGCLHESLSQIQPHSRTVQWQSRARLGRDHDDCSCLPPAKPSDFAAAPVTLAVAALPALFRTTDLSTADMAFPFHASVAPPKLTLLALRI